MGESQKAEKIQVSSSGTLRSGTERKTKDTNPITQEPKRQAK